MHYEVVTNYFIKGVTIMKKKLLTVLLAGILTLTAFAEGNQEQGAGAAAASYPEKNVQFIVPANAGGGTDVSCRLIAKYLEEDLGQPMVVVNMAGAGGSLAARKVLDSKSDGYTALYFHNSMLISHLMGITDFTYDSFKVAGIVAHMNTPSFYVNSASDIKDLPDLVTKAKANPGTITYATETGAFTHLMALAFQDAMGVEFNIVDVGTNSQKIAALKGNKIDVMPGLWGSAEQYVQNGDFRCLSMFGEERNSLAPQVPTAKEQGLDFTHDGYYFAFFFPKDTPDEVVNTMSAALERVAGNPDFLKEAEKAKMEISFMNREAAEAHIKKVAAIYDGFKDVVSQ